MRYTIPRYSQVHISKKNDAIAYLKTKSIRAPYNIKLPKGCQVWTHNYWLIYAKNHIPPARYTVEQLHQPSSLDNLREIQQTFQLLRYKEARKVKLINELEEDQLEHESLVKPIENTGYPVLKREDHPAIRLQTFSLKSEIDPKLFSLSLDLWSSTLIQAAPSLGTLNAVYGALQQYNSDLSMVEVADLPNEFFDILLSLIPIDQASVTPDDPFAIRAPTNPDSWTDFDRFWEPIISSRICILLIPQLVARAAQLHSPSVALSLLHHIDDDVFLSKLGDKVGANLCYKKGLNSALNSLIYFTLFYRVQSNFNDLQSPTSHLILNFHSDKGSQLQSPGSLQAYKNCDLIYEAIGQINLQSPELSIFPVIASCMFRQVPRRTMPDFYVQLLSKNIDLTNKHYRYLTDQLLLNGTDADRYLVMNTDLIKHRIAEETQQSTESVTELPKDGEPDGTEIHNEASSTDLTSADKDSAEAPTPLAVKLPAPTFSLPTYALMLKIAGREKNKEMETFIRDKLLTAYAEKKTTPRFSSQPSRKSTQNDSSKLGDKPDSNNALTEVLRIALQASVDTGNMEEAGALLEYWAQDPEFSPSVELYTLMFRGFRKMGDGPQAYTQFGNDSSNEQNPSPPPDVPLKNVCYAGDAGESKCFEILHKIHQMGRPFPQDLCTEILALLKDRYSARVVYEYYKAYFGVENIKNLLFDQYFSEIPEGLSRSSPPPNYVPRIYPDNVEPTAKEMEHLNTEVWTSKETKVFDTDSLNNLGDWIQFQIRAPGPMVVHKFRPLALIILYDSVLNSSQNLQHVMQLYQSFQNSDYYNDHNVYLSVIDSFVFNLCVRFGNTVAIGFAKSIVLYLLQNNESFKRFEPALKSEYTSPDSFDATQSTGYQHFPVTAPSRYPGRRLNSVTTLIRTLCRENDVVSAQEILKLVCDTSPLVTGSMFEPIVKHYYLRGNTNEARKWYDSAKSLGAHIKNPALLQVIGIETEN